MHNSTQNKKLRQSPGCLKGIRDLIRSNFPSVFIFMKTTYIFALHILSRGRWKKILLNDEVKLNLGSGPSKGENGWTNVDLLGADINHDLRKGVPLPDNSVDMVYSSHVFEHIPYRDLLEVISEIRRVLKPGGTLLVCVPNAGLYLRAYFKNEMFVSYDEMFVPAAVNTESGIDQVNYIAYLNGDHTFMFDEQNIINILKKCKFTDVDFRTFDPLIDRVERDFESMYIKASK
jgi:ubiquinone/menaquinone biosynthesis C-methylase UbiE